MTSTSSNHPLHLNWMARTSGLESLRVDELILPGTHNSGSDKQSPNTGLPQEFAQDVSPHEQLRHGIRVLDLRVRFYSSYPEGDARRFQIFHLTSSGRTVAVDILQRTREYFAELEQDGCKAREIVILDFHQFDKFTAQAHEELQALIYNGLGSRRLPYALRGLTLAQLWNEHPGKNVVVAYNYGSAGHELWPGVEQCWPGENLFNTNTLKAFVDRIGNESKRDFELKAVQCAKYSLPFHAPTDLSNKIDEWFKSVDENSYIQNFFIINTDWSLRSNIVANCRHANQIRSALKKTDPDGHLQPSRRQISSV
jgi:hypothetical protein